MKINDKVLHFGAGVIISLLFGSLCYPMFGLIMTVFAGGLKELAWDLMLDKGTPDMRDFLATLQGGIVGVLALLICEIL